MVISQNEKHREKVNVRDVAQTQDVAKRISKQPIVFSMKPEQEKQLLKDLLGNFSDQTGALFG